MTRINQHSYFEATKTGETQFPTLNHKLTAAQKAAKNFLFHTGRKAVQILRVAQGVGF